MINIHQQRKTPRHAVQFDTGKSNSFLNLARTNERFLNSNNKDLRSEPSRNMRGKCYTLPPQTVLSSAR